MSYKLEVSGFEIEISIALIKDLKLHEEIVESYLTDLVDTINKSRVIRDPVIVDRESEIVLDGMHRVAAVSKLGFDKIPVCYVNYQDSRIELGSWVRVFPGLEMKRMLEICEELGFEINHYDISQVSDLIKEKDSKLLIVSKKKAYVLSKNTISLKEIFELAGKIEEKLREKGHEPRYEPEKNIFEKIKPDEVGLVIPPASKKEVIGISSCNSVLYHKSTRHVIPARPVNINFPLSILEEDLNLAEKELTERLNKSEVDHLPPGSEFEGRKYDGELVVFKISN